MSEWTSVKEGLPPPGWYLVDFGPGHQVDILYYGGAGYWASRGREVWHWLPLPARPVRNQDLE